MEELINYAGREGNRQLMLDEWRSRQLMLDEWRNRKFMLDDGGDKLLWGNGGTDNLCWMSADQVDYAGREGQTDRHCFKSGNISQTEGGLILPHLSKQSYDRH